MTESPEPNFDVRLSICITILCLYELCLGPIMIYLGYKFYENSAKMIITKRNPKLTLMHSIISAIGLMIYSPIVLIYSSNLDPLLTIYAWWANIIMYPFVAYAFVWGITTKYWLLSFRINWIKSTQNATWKMHINQTQISENWFLRHKNTLGRAQYIFRYVIIIYVIYIASYYLVISIFGDFSVIYSLSQVILLLIPVITVIITWTKTPAIYDHLHYMEECKTMIKLGAFYMLSYLLIGLSPIFGATPYMRQIIGNVVATTLSYFVLGGYQLVYALYKLYNIRDRGKSNEHHLADYVVGRQRSVSVDQRKYGDIWATLTMILGDSDQLNGFFDHLAKEFCIECGLAYIEFIQFKSLIDKELFPVKDEDFISDNKELCILNNPEIPKSFIVYANPDKVEFYARNRSQDNHVDIPNMADHETDSCRYDNLRS